MSTTPGEPHDSDHTQPFGYPPAPSYPPPPYPGQRYPPQVPYGYPYPYYVPRRTNGLAIASLILGVLWVYWLGSILALVFGYIARKQIRQRNEDGGGLALAGIILGWVGVFFLLVMIGLLVFAGTSMPEMDPGIGA